MPADNTHQFAEIMYWMIVVLSTGSIAMYWMKWTSFISACSGLLAFLIYWIWLAGDMGMDLANYGAFGLLAFVMTAIGMARVRGAFNKWIAAP